MSIKIFLTVRNRLAITKKCITALYKNTNRKIQIHIYDNLTNHRIKNHFEYAYNLYKHNLIASYNFNTATSTFNAFSKAVASNQFGLLHNQDPKKDNYDFLLFIDNDIIVLPNWDDKIVNAFSYINKKGLSNIKVVGQIPGGIKTVKKLDDKLLDGTEISIGKYGGSGFWCTKTTFFNEVGFLDLKNLVGKSKQHDIQYWKLLNRASNNQPYIMGLHTDLCIHCGKFCGSICNVLTRAGTKEEKEKRIKFEEADINIENMKFDEFMNLIIGDKNLRKDW